MALINEWFKVIKDGKLIGLATDQNFARYSENGGRVHICNALNGQYILANDNFYHDDWMLPIDPNSYLTYENATVVSISKAEYDILSEKEDTDSDAELVEAKEADPENSREDIFRKPSEEETATVEYVRDKKLNELKDICEKEIANGFSLVLSDGASHHFSMTAEDQLNMQEMQIALLTDSGTVPYHADGELTQYYSEEDIRAILRAATQWKHYNLAYYNSLKNWIGHLSNIEEIASVTYESDIPEEYCTEVLISLVESM